MSENVTETVEETVEEPQSAADQAKDVVKASVGQTAKETDSGSATDSQKAEVRRLKLVVDGKEEELSETDASRLIAEARRAGQIKREGYKKFEEAAGLQKQFRGIKDIIHADPEAGIIELANLFGLPADTLDRLYARRSAFESRWAEMSEDQKARWMAERKVASLEGEKKERETEQLQIKQQEEYQQKLHAEEQRLSKETLPAMERAGLPPTHLTVKMVAATLGALADRDPDSPPNLDEAVEYVARVWHEQTDGFITRFEKDPGAFTKRYPTFAETLRKHYVAQATRAPGSTGKAQVSRASPQPKADEKPVSWTEFTQQMRALAAGKGT